MAFNPSSIARGTLTKAKGQLTNPAESTIESLVGSLCDVRIDLNGSLSAALSSLGNILKRIAKLRRLINMLRTLLGDPNLSLDQLDFIERQLRRLIKNQVCSALDAALGLLRKSHTAATVPNIKQRVQGQVNGALKSLPSVRVNLGRRTGILDNIQNLTQSLDTVKSIGSAAQDMQQINSDIQELQASVRSTKLELGGSAS